MLRGGRFFVDTVYIFSFRHDFSF